MGRLIKYEIKGNYKLFGGLFIIIALLNVLLLTRINKWSEQSIIGLFSVISITVMVVTLIFVINSFRNDLYEDTGYLTFTLPVSGNKILGSKIITGVLWFSVAGLIFFIFLKILIGMLFDINVLERINLYFNVKGIFTLGILFGLVNLIMLLLMIYFSITLTKVAFKGKKMSKLLGFITFIVLNAAIFYIEYKLINIFPQTIDFSLDFLKGSQGSLIGPSNVDNQAMFSINNSQLNVNIASLIYNILVYIGLFKGTGYLMDNKINI
ncbi:ABC-2 family transporter protein [Clostridium homopropionicum DSM 5847]|uniref:ABC-2 family transporter protein n=1 Tax=Clostridium homopropionicum DSM 5847 TaxID=1121318 RepID=A0A0L6Z7S4_9CLOT|nr:ABC transporter permease [Clostridium homopropionicum]KOA19014.1 ABC-2 family transporter protein [Clostridium homopropionicum DSM 5847]SFH00870.1 hypothetical protein SAMN04488501_13415 [Clostridium homopropionicum]